MKSLKQKFAAVAMSAALSFNSVAANAEQAAPDVEPTDELVQELVQEGLYLDEIGDFPTDKSTEQIKADLANITKRSQADDYLRELSNSNDFAQIEPNLSSADQLNSLLENTAISPYYVLPILVYGPDRESVLNPEMIEVLEKHGLDLEDVDTLVNVSTNGHKHLYNYTTDALEEKLNDPYIKSSFFIQENGYTELPAAALRHMKDDMAFTTKLKAIADPSAPEFTLDDIAPRDFARTQNIIAKTDNIYEVGLSALSDASYKTALYGRERRVVMGGNQVTVSSEDIMSKSYNANLESGISYFYAAGLNLPEQQNRDFDLVVTEPEDQFWGLSGMKTHSFHGDMTMRVAEGLSTQISPDGEGDSDVHFMATNIDYSEKNDILTLSQIGTDRLIFSESTGLMTQYSDLKDDLTAGISVKRVLEFSFHEQLGTMKMVAAGNEYAHFSGAGITNFNDLSDVLMAATISSRASAHTHRSVSIGAGHIDEAGQMYMSSYSSPGAAFLVETPDFYDGKIQGTSFSTPAAASYYKEIAESYGDVLTHEEMIFAGLYSTQTDIYNVNHAKAEEIDEGNIDGFGATTSSYQAALDSNEKQDISPEELTKFDKTVFRTNAAGLPYHERAGAGFLDVYKWKENLDTMRAMKSTFEHEPEFIKNTTAPQFQQGADGAEFPYHYEVPITQNMTLDKQTLYLDHTGLNALRITSPSGMESDFIGTASGYVSTRAFSGEDVSEGDVITIQSKQPLGELAEFTSRGTEDGSLIQAFRDYQLAGKDGLEPNQTYQGGKVVLEADKSPDGNLIRQAQSVYDAVLNTPSI